ncbi:glycosyl hydrolase [Bacillus sp. SCS-151]|uniref:glycosyl hydrolase n=1 Tax=Nanhaiella sioensis TaxID=3115293 RepID=UPI00397E6D4B
MKFKKILSVLTAVTISASMMLPSLPATAEISENDVPVGAGGYSTVAKGTQLYGWELHPRRTPQDFDYSTSNLDGKPLPTNDWISSVLWYQYSGALYAHPLSYQATPTGFEISNPPKTVNTLLDGENELEREHRPGQIDLEVQATTFSPVDARADKLSDWAADILMASPDGSKNMKATIAHGSPYAYFTFEGGEPKVVFKNPTTIVKHDNAYLQLSVDNNGQTNYYGLYAPAGSTWTMNGTEVVADLPDGKNYFTVAGLPDGSENTFNFYKERAFAFITDTRVDWNYHEASSTLTTDYTITTTPMEGANRETITALYPHQWRNNPLIPNSAHLYEYNSIRGNMKAISGTSFSTQYVYNGILPTMPELTDPADIAKLEDYVRQYFDYGMSLNPNFVQAGADGGNGGYDTYWMGKNLGRNSNIMPIADQLNDEHKKGEFIDSIKSTLEWWFTPTKYNEAGQPIEDNYFYYDDHWKTLIGYSANYFSDTELNDHHFHWGYWIYAAAQVALQEPNTANAWDSNSQWGGMVNELVDDIATVDRNSDDYPFLRNFDPYAGHSWANGMGFIDADDWRYGGNNHESSSEAMNAWASLILWGEATGNSEIRDAGIYMFTTEQQAINNYWFDIYGDVFEPEFSNDDAVMVWGGKYNHTTWWTENPIEAHGIQMLPITPASLYLGRDPNYVKHNYDNTYAEFPNYLQKKAQYGWQGLDNPDTWQDILVSYYALYDPAEALAKWKDEDSEVDPAVGVEFGETRAHTYHWIRSLDVYGLPNFDITANSPLYSVFSKDGNNTYVAYNASDFEQTVTFSDCFELVVPANAMAQETAVSPGGNCSATPPGGGNTDPDIEAPSSPENLQLSGKTASTVDLTWAEATDDTGVVAYDIYQDGEQVASTPSVTYQITGLTGETTYTFEVIARDAAGNLSNPSNSLIVTTDPAPDDNEAPTAPTNVDYSSKSETTVDLTWRAATDNIAVEGYDVYQDGVYVGSTTATAYQVTGLTTNTTYTFEIIAKDAVGNESVASNQLIITTDATPGSGGNNEIVTDNYTINIIDQGTDITFKFTPTGNVSNFVDLHYKINNGAQQNVRMIENGVTWEYTIQGLSEGDTVDHSYTYTLGQPAYVSETYSYIAGSDSGSPPNDAEAPTAPQGLISTAQSETTITITWEAASDNVGVVGYDIYKDGVYVDNTALTTYQITGLSGDTTYSFEVIARDAAGNESAGSTIDVTTEAPPIDGNPDNGTISHEDFTIDIENNGGSATFHFTPTGEASNFVDLHYTINGGAQQNVGTTNNAGTWEYTINGLTTGDTIEFFYTYTIGTPAYDSAWYEYTH